MELWWLEIFDSGKPGKRTLIVGGTHGNEKIWIYVLDKIRSKLYRKDYEGIFYLLLGNPKALMQNKRYLDEDLNRAFNSQQSSYEAKRAQSIKNYFHSIPLDVVYDIHSTPTKSQPMIICTDNPASLALAKQIPIEPIVLGLIESVHGVSLTKYFSQQGAIDLAFECGMHDDLEQNPWIQPIVETIRAFHHDIPLSSRYPHTIIKIKKQIRTQDTTFRFNQKYSGFEKLSQWIVWGEESCKVYQEEKDSILLIPNAIPHIQEEIAQTWSSRVGYIGEIIESDDCKDDLNSEGVQ